MRVCERDRALAYCIRMMNRLYPQEFFLETHLCVCERESMPWPMPYCRPIRIRTCPNKDSVGRYTRLSVFVRLYFGLLYSNYGAFVSTMILYVDTRVGLCVIMLSVVT